MFGTQLFESVLSLISKYVQPSNLRPGGGDVEECGGEGVEGGVGGVEVHTDGGLALGQEVRELRTEPVHLGLTTRQKLDESRREGRTCIYVTTLHSDGIHVCNVRGLLQGFLFGFSHVKVSR